MACFHLSGIFVAWLRFQWPEATVISVILLVFLWAFWHYGKRIHERFQIPEEQLVSGELNLGGFNPEMSGAINCPTCKTIIPPSFKFCTVCGQKAEPPRMQSSVTVSSCDRCGQALLPNAKFCGSCGAGAKGNRSGALSSMSLEASLAFPRFSTDKRRNQTATLSSLTASGASIAPRSMEAPLSQYPSYDEQVPMPASPAQQPSQKQSLMEKFFPSSSAVVFKP
eukprot:CAMPEP_0196664076 /NCGR_PEP_ID=MMETSP1086-20130531/55508_1 /TAXON_ID=77921 /ORGANISM="Cyanoptyche  gloeocystis , Strain SAG4.97" /LENGTH=223 /DNA_ID=CAMNT_0042000197 /DNA_START=55 /DNA_END=726 /DNA_ORIENTATION=-